MELGGLLGDAGSIFCQILILLYFVLILEFVYETVAGIRDILSELVVRCGGFNSPNVPQHVKLRIIQSYLAHGW